MGSLMGRRVGGGGSDRSVMDGNLRPDGPFRTSVLCANSVPTQPNRAEQENTERKTNLI